MLCTPVISSVCDECCGGSEQKMSFWKLLCLFEVLPLEFKMYGKKQQHTTKWTEHSTLLSNGAIIQLWPPQKAAVCPPICLCQPPGKATNLRNQWPANCIKSLVATSNGRQCGEETMRWWDSWHVLCNFTKETLALNLKVSLETTFPRYLQKIYLMIFIC